MNFLKKGPELKMPELELPDFLLDVYYDLRERHLLPLVALLIVAIVAVPFLLGGSSESEPEGGESAVATPSSVPTSKLVVAKSAPGLRDYRRRLGDEHTKDPFVQQYSKEGEGGGGSGPGGDAAPGGGEEGGITIEPNETGGGAGSESPLPPEESNGEPPAGGQLKYYSWAIDVRVTPVAADKGKDKPKPTVRKNLPDMTMLPSRSVPALTFIGVTKDEKRAVMLVSDRVSGLFGDGICVVGSEACQLLALEPGLPETVVYGADSRTYRIELIKLRLLKTDKLNVAPLGPSKKSSKDREGKKAGEGDARP
ncbi:MAG TPA: hypothetical protein VG898_08310 [Solirubrobacterales bacterium]|nr:hypothetical protein [Solirubrobacterales bacterium]